MPRDASGVYSLPAGTDDFVANTVIESGKIDTLTADLKTDLNNLTNGTNFWTGQLKAADGTVLLPGITFKDDLDSGLYRIGADNVGFSVGGVKIGDWSSTGLVVTGLLEPSKGADIASAATLNLTTATGMFPDITGTTTVTAVTLGAGKWRMARAVGAVPFTASANLIINGSSTVDYTARAGDWLLFEGYASSVVRMWVLNALNGTNLNLPSEDAEISIVDKDGTGIIFGNTAPAPDMVALRIGAADALRIVSGEAKFTAHVIPSTDDGYALGTTANKWSDAFFAAGAVINFAAGNTTLTQSSGNLALGGSAADVVLDLSAANAGQIKFPGTQNASADANTQDDYEEGTWTPFDNSGEGLTFSTAVGKYTKIGREVCARWRADYPSAAGGNNLIGGLPFSATAGEIDRQGYISFSSESTCFRVLIDAASANIRFFNASGNQISNATLSGDANLGGFVYAIS